MQNPEDNSSLQYNMRSTGYNQMTTNENDWYTTVSREGYNYLDISDTSRILGIGCVGSKRIRLDVTDVIIMNLIVSKQNSN